MMASLFDDPRLLQGIVAGLIVLIILAVPLSALMRRDPFRALMVSQKPRRRRLAGQGLAAWEGAATNTDLGSPGRVPEIERHLLAIDETSCAIRAGALRHRWNLTLAIAVAAPAIGLGLLIIIERFLAYLSWGSGRCIRYAQQGEVFVTEMTPLPQTLAGFLHEVWCGFTLTLHPADSEANGITRLFSALLRAEVFGFVVLFCGVAVLLFLILRRDPAPVIVMREGGFVATKRRGQVYAARWLGARITASKGAGRTACLAIAMHRLRPDGTWSTNQRWFRLSGWSGRKPWRWERDDGAWEEWNRQRLWITAWISGTIDVPAPFGVIDRIEASFEALPPGPYEKVGNGP